MKSAIKFFDSEDADIFQQAERLHRALTHLKYEGKLTLAKNLKEVKESAGALGVILKRHLGLQEKVVFPYISTHIPRYETTVHFLESEHEEIDRHCEKLLKAIREFQRSGSSLKNSGEVYENGIFLVSLLRHHLNFELRNIRLLMGKELRLDEKIEIGTRMKKWLKKHSLKAA